MMLQPYTVGLVRRMLRRERTVNPGPVATELLRRRIVRAAVRKLLPQRVRRIKILKRLGRGNPAPAAVIGAAKAVKGIISGARLKTRAAIDKERFAVIDALAVRAIDGDELAIAELERLAQESATAKRRAYAAQQLGAVRKAHQAAEREEDEEATRLSARERGAREREREAQRQELRREAIGTAGTVASALLGRGRRVPRRRARRRAPRRFSF